MRGRKHAGIQNTSQNLQPVSVRLHHLAETRTGLNTYLKQVGTPTDWTHHHLRFWRSLVRRCGGNPAEDSGVNFCGTHKMLYVRFTIYSAAFSGARYTVEGEKRWQNS